VFDAVDVIGGESGRETAWRALVAQVSASPGEGIGNDVFGRLGREVVRWQASLTELVAATGIKLAADDIGDHLALLAERTATLRHAIDELADWVAFHDARHTALAAGVGPAVGAIERGDLAASDLAPAWERATLLAWADAELADSLVADGAAHHAHVSAFADLDRAALALVRSRALVRFAERVPSVPAGKLDPDTELGQLVAEVRAVKPTHTLRELFAAAPLVLPRIAPCIAVTPSALAAHLDPKLMFDIVVIDHASQLATASAIGAVSRGRSAVIVGDSQLLPPLRLVRGSTSAEVGGLLADAIAARLPELRLAWHYRGRHEALMAYVNERFYGDRLQVFPAMQASSELGLAAKAIGRPSEIVAELLTRLRDATQQGRSLGVVVFSRALRDQVLDLLDEARRDDLLPDELSSERLCVEHVEDAQTLVRDVVLVVLDESAIEPRRLAVALTRAREQLVLCTGSLPDDLGDFTALIARAKAMSFQGDEQPPASAITAAIARALGERGWAVRHQVGSGAYKIDLAVVDPADPERYVLAIETDGAAYASATVARDRDRLRPHVLAQLGWRLHRVWSLDWWANPEGEIQRAHNAIVTAIAATRRRAPAPAPVTRAPRAARGTERAPAPSIAFEATTPRNAPIRVSHEPSGRHSVAVPGAEIPDTLKTMPTLAAGSAPIKIGRNSIPIGPYVAAAIPPGRRTPDDLFAPRHLPELGKVIEQVLAAEAPMHVGLLARRVGAYFGIGRVTQRVTDQIRTVLDGRGKLGDEQDIVWRLDQDPAAIPAVRVAGSSGQATVKREIAEIPLSELAAAARIVVERASHIATGDLVRDAARLIGFARITPQVSERVAEGVRLAQLRELIEIDAGKAKLPV
jgi:very-short-patch-repair endonuclease